MALRDRRNGPLPRQHSDCLFVEVGSKNNGLHSRGLKGPGRCNLRATESFKALVAQRNSQKTKKRVVLIY